MNESFEGVMIGREPSSVLVLGVPEVVFQMTQAIPRYGNETARP
jgi:hypothetical protein